jgi:hypothetical protein
MPCIKTSFSVHSELLILMSRDVVGYRSGMFYPVFIVAGVIPNITIMGSV